MHPKPPLFRSKYFIWLFVLIAHGFLLQSPFMDSMKMVAQGDHGLSFYCFKKTLDGQVPYRDYFWNYGPLMPYYYAACFKFLGTAIPSVLFGKMLLSLLSGVAIFSAIAVFFSPAVGYLAALWFWLLNPDFFYRFDQAGAILAVLTAVYLLFRHLKGSRDPWIFAMPVILYGACLIKLNIGLSTLAAVVISMRIHDLRSGKKLSDSKRLYVFLVIGVPALTAATYAVFLAGLPDHYLRQCFPLLKSYEPQTQSLAEAFTGLIAYCRGEMFADIRSRVASFVFIACAAGYLLRTRLKSRRPLTAALIALGLLTAFNLHEFFLSGTQYRIFWVTPLAILSMFLLFGAECEKGGRPKRYLLYAAIVVLLAYAMEERGVFGSGRLSERYFDHPRARVYLLGQQPGWRNTVQEAAAYLDRNLGPGESFLALPYEPIYYYLTGRDSPTWEFLFFKFQNIPEEEEDEIISRLESGAVRFVLMSNRMKSVEAGLGWFGVTHCAKLSRYISDHYALCATFGDWDAPAGWAWNHAVKIYKRREGIR